MDDTTGSGQNRSKRNFLITAAVFIAALFYVRDGIFRALWFDEALTFMNFAALPGPAEIYHNYVIPNNHIIYTILLKYWAMLYQPVIAFDVHLRLLSVVLTLGAFALMIFLWKKQCGIMPVALICLCFAFSLPFAIYSVAIRGYMLSFMLVAAAMELARLWMHGTNWKTGTGYFIVSLLAVGAIPSNIIAIGAVVLCFAGFPLKNRKFVARFLFLAIMPLIALLLFYFPIWNVVSAKILKLKEGWPDGVAAMIVLYSSWIISFLPAILAAILALPLLLTRKKSRLNMALAALVLLLPVPFFFVLSPAPFPRVFFALWPVWMYLLCRALGHLLAFARLRKYRIAATPMLLLAIFAGAIFVWGMAQQEIKEDLSVKLVGTQALDDYFSPYYMKSYFNPFDVVKALQAQGETEFPKKVFVSFDADPYSIIFYGNMLGVPFEVWRFDGPRGRVSELDNNCRRAVIVGEGDENKFLQRFKGKTLEPLSTAESFQHIYLVKDSESASASGK
jgi:hypothetical protein